jgi:hypothetical protein
MDPVLAYGWTHQRVRAQLLAALRAAGGGICPLCGGVMTAAMRLHLHHTNPVAKQMGLPGDALAHAKCNLGFGNGRRKQRRRRVVQSRVW